MACEHIVGVSLSEPYVSMLNWLLVYACVVYNIIFFFLTLYFHFTSVPEHAGRV